MFVRDAAAQLPVDEGFTYEVSDEQIAAYPALPIHVRIAWVEETARLTYSLASPEVRERWARLRRRERIEP